MGMYIIRRVHLFNGALIKEGIKRSKLLEVIGQRKSIVLKKIDYYHDFVKVRSQKKKNDIIWEFFPTGGGGLPKSKNFCKFTKYFFVCQIHYEVLKYVPKGLKCKINTKFFLIRGSQKGRGPIRRLGKIPK